ncbi:MAG: DUF4292 domain-containing protein [Bacteroidales bacterium]|nr:DUF4292 domain-containing protein [Bacteroidales bacterium]
MINTVGKRIIKYILILSSVMFLFVSCKVAFVGGRKAENIRPPKLYRELLDNQFEYNNLNMRFSADFFIGDEKEEFSGMIRMKKDTAIWISLRSYNIEGARMLITKDSVKFINRLDKTYYSGGFLFLTHRFDMDLDYSMIQAIITNSFFFYPQTEDASKSISNFKSCYDSSLYCMSSISQRKYVKFYVDEKNPERWERKLEKEIGDTLGISSGESVVQSNDFVFQFVKVLPELFRINDMLLENYIQQQSLYVEYGKQFLVENQYFPHQINIELITPKFAPRLVINIESLTIDAESLSLPFKISKKYEKIEL